MKCEDSQNLIMKYFDRELNDIEEAQMKQHIKNCKKCRDEFESLREIFSVVELETEIEPPEDFERQVMYRIESEGLIRKKAADNGFLYETLLVTLLCMVLICLGNVITEAFKGPVDFMQLKDMANIYVHQIFSAAVSMCRGIAIAVVSVAASIYKTYYYLYIAMAGILLISVKMFFKILKDANLGTVLEECNE